MSSSFIRLFSLLGAVALFGLGCNSNDTNGSATTTASGNRPTNADSPLVPVSPPDQVSGRPEEPNNWRVPGSGASLCNHPYYPLRTGYEVLYKNNYFEPTNLTDRGNYVHKNYRSRVTQADSNSAVIKISFEGSTIEAAQTIDCTQEGLKAKAYVDLSSLRGGNGSVITTTETAGLLLPNDLRVGSSWTQSFSFTTKIPGNRLQPRPIEVRGKVTIRRKAAREEMVDLGAGRFNAIAVETTTESTMEFPGQGSIPYTSQGIEYWVRGKGLVKTEAWIDDTTFSATAEAQTITIP